MASLAASVAAAVASLAAEAASEATEATSEADSLACLAVLLKSNGPDLSNSFSELFPGSLL